MAFQIPGDSQGILRVSGHSQVQGLEALHEEEGVERRQGRAEVAQERDAGLDDVGDVPQGLERFDEVDPVIARVRLGDQRELAVGPVELAGIDDQAADGCAVTADELGGGVDDDIDAEVDRPQQVGCDRVVEHQRNPVAGAPRRQDLQGPPRRASDCR